MKMLSLRTLLVALVLVFAVDGKKPFPGCVLESSDLRASYDYVVVGGGTSGLVVANRLSEDNGTSVLIIEAGGFDENEDWITIPLVSTGNLVSLSPGVTGTKYDWNMTGTPQAELNNRRVMTPAGKVVGGGTVLNGMVNDRGSKYDYDAWEKLGNAGWNFETLFPYLKKMETSTPPDPKFKSQGWDIGYVPEYHGEHGFVHSSFPNFVWPTTKTLISAMDELKIPILNDSMGGHSVGAYWFIITIDPKDETRSTSANFYRPERPNLHLLTGNTVTRVLFDERKAAVGVEFASAEGQVRKTVLASKEVILAAGALHTPQILQLSGIGNEALLAPLGIRCVVDLVGVGQNYHDHVLLFTPHKVDVSFGCGNFTNATWAAEQRQLYDSKKEGPLTTTGANVMAFLSLGTFANASAYVDMAKSKQPYQYLASNTTSSVAAGFAAQRNHLINSFTTTSSASVEFIYDDIAILPILQKPFSRGSVLINSTSAFATPVINPRYLSDPLDLAILIEGFKYARTIRRTAAMQGIRMVETYPGDQVVTDAQIEAFVRGNADTAHHHVGTASMLPRELGGVVDTKLRVYGVRGLRVVDASVVPLIPGAHLQATVYGVAEKASTPPMYQPVNIPLTEVEAADLIRGCE